ncbi:hypothetical protein BMS_2685 [Halobacteriovorax marinus SJ]|uniref:Uncharacterized protein n=1 Tax=Halobacteriovorax marinus (strain ATCC BAA-682 / DSM 15412 / SJ) TaxID=862908 RepID=E1WXE7_HALMS|nr:hypothetical protein [Halobacteriovorax marinus]CBW27464.1 hypothetical protein BMS_2685 [Halobacteriovorax marinus SJ]
MDSPNIDIDFLAKETLALSEALKGSEDFGQPSLFDGDFQFERGEDFLLRSDRSVDQSSEDKTSRKEEIEIEVKVKESSAQEVEDDTALCDSLFEVQLPQDVDIEFSSVLEEEEEIVDEQEELFPMSPGLIFKIDAGISTFCVRGVLCHNINESVHGVMNNENDSWKKLKIREREELSGIHYFETASIEQSEMIAEYILNKRFPLQEEMVCNLSDPGFSWWLESNDEGMKIYFKAQSVERDTQFTRLGPIGDRGIASLKFLKCESMLRRLFSISEYSTTEKSFEVRPINSKDNNYLNFKDIFEKGEFNFEFSSSELTLEQQRLVIFLQEIAAVRGFWISVEEILNNKP